MALKGDLDALVQSAETVVVYRADLERTHLSLRVEMRAHELADIEVSRAEARIAQLERVREAAKAYRGSRFLSDIAHGEAGATLDLALADVEAHLGARDR